MILLKNITIQEQLLEHNQTIHYHMVMYFYSLAMNLEIKQLTSLVFMPHYQMGKLFPLPLSLHQITLVKLQ